MEGEAKTGRKGAIGSIVGDRWRDKLNRSCADSLSLSLSFIFQSPLNSLVRDENWGKIVVPGVRPYKSPKESRPLPERENLVMVRRDLLLLSVNTEDEKFVPGVVCAISSVLDSKNLFHFLD